MGNIRNSTENIRRRKGKMKAGGIRGGDEPEDTMDPRKQTEGFRGEGMGVGLAQ